jgi:hypothetical protein
VARLEIRLTWQPELHPDYAGVPCMEIKWCCPPGNVRHLLYREFWPINPVDRDAERAAAFFQTG